MDDGPLRTTAWIVYSVLSIPLLIVLLRGWTLLARDWALPGWIHGVVTFGIFAGSYVGLGYLVAYLLDRYLEAKDS